MSMAYYTPYIPQNMDWQDEYEALAVDNLANPANQNKVIHLNNAGDLEFLEPNVANGFVKLGGGGKIPSDLLPAEIMSYHGQYDVLTNTPALSDGGSHTAGDIYQSTTTGTRNFGSGVLSITAGDWLIYNGTTWEKSTHVAYNKTEADNKFLQIVNGVEKSGSTMTGNLTVPKLLCDTIGHGLNDNIIDFTGSDIVINKNIDMTGFGIWQSAEINSLLAQFTTLSAGSFTCRDDIGTGAVNCKALTCTSINTTNGNLTMGTGDISCDAITTTGTITCKAINTQNSALTLGTGTITTTGATSTGALTCTTMSSMGGNSGTRYSGMFQNTDSNYGNACAISLALGSSPIDWTTPNVFGLRHAIFHSNSLGNMSYRVAIQRYNSPASQDLQYTTMNANEVLSTTLRGNFTIDNDANIITPSCSLTVKNLGTGVVHSNSAGLLSSSLIVNADITDATIAETKLATSVSTTSTANSIVKRDASSNVACAGLTCSSNTVSANATTKILDVVTSNATNDKIIACIRSSSTATPNRCALIIGSGTNIDTFTGGAGLQIRSGYGGPNAGSALTYFETRTNNHGASAFLSCAFDIISGQTTTALTGNNITIGTQSMATWKLVRRNVNSFTGDGGSSAKTITLASGETTTDILCTGGGTVIYPTITIAGSPSVLTFTQTWTNGVAYVLSATSIA